MKAKILLLTLTVLTVACGPSLRHTKLGTLKVTPTNQKSTDADTINPADFPNDDESVQGVWALVQNSPAEEGPKVETTLYINDKKMVKEVSCTFPDRKLNAKAIAKVKLDKSKIEVSESSSATAIFGKLECPSVLLKDEQPGALSIVRVNKDEYKIAFSKDDEYTMKRVRK